MNKKRKTGKIIAIVATVISFAFLIILFFLSESLNVLQNVMLSLFGFVGIIAAPSAILILEL
jgi:hypothetical protein